MSDDPYFATTDKSKYLRDRRGINNLLPNANYRALARCNVCAEQPRLEVRNDCKGNPMGVCVRGCGSSFPLERNPDPTNLTKYRVKFAPNSQDTTTCKPIVLSKKPIGMRSRKPNYNSVNDNLTDEDIADIRSMTGSEPS